MLLPHTKTLVVYENCQFPMTDLALKKENLKFILANRKSKYHFLPSNAQYEQLIELYKF